MTFYFSDSSNLGKHRRTHRDPDGGDKMKQTVWKIIRDASAGAEEAAVRVDGDIGLEEESQQVIYVTFQDDKVGETGLDLSSISSQVSPAQITLLYCTTTEHLQNLKHVYGLVLVNEKQNSSSRHCVNVSSLCGGIWLIDWTFSKN